jgi:hypothetical protein
MHLEHDPETICIDAIEHIDIRDIGVIGAILIGSISPNKNLIIRPKN